MQHLSKLLILCCALILSACATIQPKAPGTHYLPWKQRTKQLENINEWTIDSAIGITSKTGHDLATVNWQQHEQEYLLNIYGPLGLGSISITGAPGKVTLWQSASKHVSATTPESLMQSQLGWYIPIANMRYWIRGLPAPHYPAKFSLDKYNHLAKLKQQGWQIRYAAFAAYDNIDLPTKIYLQNKQLAIKLVIKNWLFTSKI